MTDAEEYLVLVHAAGGLEDEAEPRYWTEVPALAACMREADGIEQVLEETNQAIVQWLARTRGTHSRVRITAEMEL